MSKTLIALVVTAMLVSIPLPAMAWSAMSAAAVADDAAFLMDSRDGALGDEAGAGTGAGARETYRPVIVRGVVQLPDGMPVERAVIVSSAGGKAVTESDGSFTIEVDISSDADSLGLTAVATVDGVNYTANSVVAIDRGGNARDKHSVTLHLSDACEPAWVPTFGGVSGVGSSVYVLAVFDDGSGGGPALYAGGSFAGAGGVSASRIAKWDGEEWSALGTGMGGSYPNAVWALAVFDDGSGGGPALYAGGQFTTAGGVTVNRIAKWDGEEWSPLGSGMSRGAARVEALAVFDDGSGGGPALYAGGQFTTAGGVTVNHIAKWDGKEWSALGSGMNNRVRALTVFDDGSGDGPALYAGGHFTMAGGEEANYIAKWDGEAWSALGTGVSGGPIPPTVKALTVFDDGFGGGPALYAGGAFMIAGGVNAARIAKWDGSSWSAVGLGVNHTVFTMTVIDDDSGGGPALYAGGSFTVAGVMTANRIAKWNGNAWSALGTGVNTTVRALTVFDDGSGSGPAIYAGGQFTTAGGVTAIRIAKWDGEEWSVLGGTGVNNQVRALTVFDDDSGGGPALYAGGWFSTVGSVEANRIAKWDGDEWSPLGSGMNGSVLALTVFDDGLGDGPALYAGGSFTTAGGMEVNRIAKWDGSSWSALGTGMNSLINILTVFDDGSGGGPALYAGGQFNTAGGVEANNISKWDGSSWSPLGKGVNNQVHALTVFDDGSGSGPALYAGGQFTTAGGVTVNRIAKWDGSSWSALGSGVSDSGSALTVGSVTSLTVFDDASGGGPALYAGGTFTSAGGVEANHIAKWDGVAWSALGTGIEGGDFSGVFALTVFDEGSGGGPALYAGGSFITAGGVEANHIAKWDGVAWSALGTGMVVSFPETVSALTVFDEGSGGGPALYAGGGFVVSPAGDSYLAKWQGCPECALADLNCDGVVDVDDLFILLIAWGACADPDDCPADLNGDNVVDVDDLFILLAEWG